MRRFPRAGSGWRSGAVIVIAPGGGPFTVAAAGGFDGGQGAYFTNYREDLHAYGPTAPLLPGGYGCVSIDPDGNRRLIRLIADPLA